MKRILFSLALIGITASSFGATLSAVVSGRAVAGGPAAVTIWTNRASVYSIQLVSPLAQSAVIKLYDVDRTNAGWYGTNWCTSNSIISRVSYATNYAYAFTNMVTWTGTTGYVNWQTNVGLYTLTSTNSVGTTNESPVMITLTVPPNSVSTYNCDLIFARGISALPDTNGVTMIINYNE